MLHTFPTVVPGGSGTATGAASSSIPAEIPKPLAPLSKEEKKVWTYLTEALKEYGLIHKTDTAMMMVIVKTFCRWVDAEAKLDDLIKAKGSYITTTPNGYDQPHQIFYVVRQLKKELLQWLPEAALTIPSFRKLTADVEESPQGDLFGDPVEQFRKRKEQLGLRTIQGGAPAE